MFFVRRSSYNSAVEMLQEAETKIVELTKALNNKTFNNAGLVIKNKRLEFALEKIIDQDTRAANSTVRRIINIARGALNK